MSKKKASKRKSGAAVRSSDGLSIRQKRVWAAVWINRCRFGVWRFENTTLAAAAIMVMHQFRREQFYAHAKFDRKLRASKHPIAKALREKLGIKENPGFEPFSLPPMETPDWAMRLPIEKLMEQEIISDPSILGDGMVAVARVSTHYRYAATTSALPQDA